MLQNLWIQSYGIICTVGCLMVAWVFLCNIAASMNTGRGDHHQRGFTLGGLDRLFAFAAVRIVWPTLTFLAAEVIWPSLRAMGRNIQNLVRYIRSRF